MPVQVGLDDFKTLAVQALDQRDGFQISLFHVGSPSQVTSNFLASGMNARPQSEAFAVKEW
jgi:hypothetical protein